MFVLKVQHDDGRKEKQQLELEVAVTVSKERSAWGTLAPEGVCSLGVSKGTTRREECFVSKSLKSFKLALLERSNRLTIWQPTAWEGGGRMVKGLFIPQVPATQRCACAPGAANKHP